MRAQGKLLAVGIALLVSVACGSTRIGNEVDKTYNFSNWKTFGWMPPHGEMGEGSPFWPTVKKAVEDALAEKGMRPATSGAPDFLVSFYNGSGPMTDVQTWGYYYGGWWTANPRVLNDDDFMKGVVVVDLIDPGTKQLAYRGAARKSVSDRVINKPDEMLKILKDLLPQMLRDLPARKA
jgi:hypothetical protein